MEPRVTMPHPATQHHTLTIPTIDGLDALNAACAYARAGWYVGPVQPGTKHPGSILGRGWQSKTTRDPQIIADTWMEHPDAGVFLHVGRSGGIVLDVDTPINLPDILTEALTETPAPFQYTRRNDLARRHYVYTQPTGRRFGNGLGNLPAGWGDIRGVNGVIIVAPSQHPDPEGHYAWGRTGNVPELPATIARALTDTTDTADVASDATIRAFITEHTSGDNRAQIDAWVATFNRYVREGDSRHQRATSILTGALKEAAAGYYPAAHAEQQLRDAFLTAVTTDGVSEKQGKARSPHAALNEWRGILAWAVAQARAADPQKARERAEMHAPTIDLDQYATGPSGRVDTTTGEILDQQPETPTSTTPQPVEEADSSSLDALLDPNTEDEDQASWEPIDADEILDGTLKRPTPRLLTRTDGPALLYPGKTHTIFGESESGKSWVAQYVAVETLVNGGRVLYVDFESDALDVFDRLQTIGAAKDHLRAPHFAYVRPDASPLAFREQEAFAKLLAQTWDYVVLDGVTEALNLHGKSSLDNDEITQWMRAVPRRFSRETGAAVVLVDHVVKSTENRGRFPIGGQAKIAAIDGAAFLVEPVAAIGPGLDGALTIRVTKDRPGVVRSHAGGWRKTDRTQEAARVRIDSSGDGTRITVEPPQKNELSDEEKQQIFHLRFLEKVSEVLSEADEPLSKTRVAETLRSLGYGGRWGRADEGLNELVRRGFAASEPGPRSARLYRSLGVYLSVNDPESPEYAGDLDSFRTH